MATRKPAATRKIAKPAKKISKPAPAKAIAKKAVAKKAVVKKLIARKSVAKKAPAKNKAPGRKTLAAKAIAPKPIAKKPAVKTVLAGKIVQKAVARPAANATIARTSATTKKTAPPPRARRKISATQAMTNTLALLEAKNEKARQPPNYPVGDAAHPGSNASHDGDAAQPETAPTERLTDAIHGHALATERGNQSKRGQS